MPTSTGPSPSKPVKTGSAPADADAAMDSLVPQKIVINVRPAKGKEKYRLQADKLRLSGAGFLEAWRRQEDVLSHLAADMTIRRVCVARVLYDRALWPKYPTQFDPSNEPEDEDAKEEWGDERDDWEIVNRSKVPIILERRNPKHVAWRLHNGTLLVVAEEYTTTALEALQTFRGYPKAREHLMAYREMPAQPVIVRDVWYGKWRCMYVDDVPIFDERFGHVVEHGYSCIPYIIAAFRELPFEAPQERYRGMLTNSAGLYPAESNVLTMHMAILAWNAWRTWTGWTHDDRDIEVIPGQYIPIAKHRNEYIEMMQGEAVPPEVLNTAQTFDQYIQRNGVAQGPRTAEGTRSGQQLWAIQAMRAMKIEKAKMALAALLSCALGYAHEMLEKNVKEPLTLPVSGKDKEGKDIGEVTIKPSDIRGYYHGFKVNMVQRLDPALLEQAKALMALAQNNWMPWRESVEQSGLTDNPVEWEDMIYREKAERSPVLADLTTLERIREFYDPDYSEEQHKEFGQALVKRLEERMMQEGALGGQQGGKPGGGPAGGGPIQPPGMKGPVTTGAELSKGLTPGRKGPSGRPGGGPGRGGGGRTGGSYGG